jgi:plastocyanin
MIWLWRIFFSSAALVPVWAVTVSGSVELAASRDPAVRHHHDYRGVVVWLEPAGNRKSGSLPLHLPARRLRYTLDQKNKRFVPHILAVPVGATVDFPNHDPIFHNAFSEYAGQIFEFALYPPGSSKAVVFTRPGIVRVFCSIHPTMSAVIAVLDTPWFAVTDAKGAFRIPGVPPGDYQLHFFHERATPETLNALTRRLRVAPGAPPLPRIEIAETGYIPAPHKDKYGRDYPPVIDGNPAYPESP